MKLRCLLLLLPLCAGMALPVLADDGPDRKEGPPRNEDARRDGDRPDEGLRRPGPPFNAYRGGPGMARGGGPRPPVKVHESDDHPGSHAHQGPHAHHGAKCEACAAKAKDHCEACAKNHGCECKQCEEKKGDCRECAKRQGDAKACPKCDGRGCKACAKGDAHACKECDEAKSSGCKECAEHAKRDHKAGKHGRHGGDERHARHHGPRHHFQHARVRGGHDGDRDGDRRRASVAPSHRFGPMMGRAPSGRPGGSPFAGPHGGGHSGDGPKPFGSGRGPSAGGPPQLDEVNKKLDRLIAAVEELSRSLKK